jgi:CheY-like chemotaxis protein/HPt (histidine-containing phosphotransfer) domain-containing protein
LPSRVDALRDGRLILVAEDNVTNQKVIVRQLALLGYAADVADNGRRALEMWCSGDYGLLLTDLHMPEMDGYELASQIREKEMGRARKPILALTANTLEGEAERCRIAGMDDYLSKPLQLANLQLILARWLPVPDAAPGLRLPAQGGTMPVFAPPVDVRVLEKSIGADPQGIREIFEDFCHSAEKIALELRAAVAGARLRHAADEAHKLKSSSRAIGALALGELCAQIEIAAGAGRMDLAHAVLPTFDLELNAVIAFLVATRAPRPDRRRTDP